MSCTSWPQRAAGELPRQFALEQLEARRLLANGLTVNYHDGTTLSGPLVATRVDSVVDFNWRGTQPGATTPKFAAVWTGQLKAKFSEFHTVFVRTNGGVKLWVNGNLLMDEWSNASAIERAAKLTVKFLSGKFYNIRLEYVNRNNPGQLKLMWSSTRTPKVVIPSANLVSTDSKAQKMRISFRPSSSAPPQYYRADNGLVFGDRGGGYKYGWDSDISAYMVDRNSPASYTERHDAFANMNAQAQKRTWRVAVPNGRYYVRVVAGDPVSQEGAYWIDVEGVSTVRGLPNSLTKWYDGTATVNVTDGDITITNAAGVGIFANKINFVEITPVNDSDRFVEWILVGGSGEDPQDRYVSPYGFVNGWTGYVDGHIKPALARGVRRFVLHNPFGFDANAHMVLDQYLQAKNMGLTWLTDDFVEAWKPITAMAGVEVIAYIGSDGPMGFNNNATGWMNFWASVKPLLDAKMSIGFDAMELFLENTLQNAAAQKLQSMDVKVYVEARPAFFRPWWHNYRVIVMDSYWRSSDPDLQPWNEVWAAHNDQLTGEIIRWVNDPPAPYTWESSGWLAPVTSEILRDGNTAGISTLALWQLDQANLNFIITRMNGLQPPPAPASAPVTAPRPSRPQKPGLALKKLTASVLGEILI